MSTYPQHTALLVMDMQMGTLSMLPKSETIIAQVARAIVNARANNIPVIYVTVGFRQGTPEINRYNKGFATHKERFSKINMEEFTKVHTALAPAGTELTVMKRRVSAFTGSDLQVVLSAFEIRHLVLTGIATSGVVLSTLREAADKDYQLTVLSDGCADADEEVHRVLTTKVFPRQADVWTVKEWANLSS